MRRTIGILIAPIALVAFTSPGGAALPQDASPSPQPGGAAKTLTQDAPSPSPGGAAQYPAQDVPSPSPGWAAQYPAQDVPSPPPGPVDADFLAALCAANATSEDELATCLDVVRTILAAPITPPALDAPGTDDAPVGPELLTRLGEIVDEAVAAARDTDVQAAIEAAVASAQDVELEALIAAAIEEAEAAVDGIDVQAIVDDALAQALAAAGAIDVSGTIEQGIETTRNVVDAAELWVVENAEMVCDGGSVGSGAAAAAVVGYLTGSPGLAIRAFEETEEVARDVCDGMTSAG